MPPGPREFEERDGTDSQSTTPPSTVGLVPEYSEQEVGLHRTRKDCWVIYKDVVYDVTEFVEGHPGGAEVLLDYAGTDITDVFHSMLPHDHSDAAIGMLAEYKIGLLKDPEFKLGKRTEAEQSMFVKPEEANIIDLEKPIVTQMWAARMPLEQYLRYTHTPHFLKGNRVARFFENPIMEFLSRNTWHVVLLWIPVAYYCVTVGGEALAPAATAFLYAFGIFMWTFLEYSMHRWIFHMDDKIPDHPLFICAHFLLHGVHHFLPMDGLRLVMPPALALVLIQPIYWSLHFLLGQSMAMVAFAGGLSGYILYDLTHYYLHHGVPFTKHLRTMKSYHLNHHYKNYHLGYGITSKLWDYVFDTVLDGKKQAAQ